MYKGVAPFIFLLIAILVIYDKIHGMQPSTSHAVIGILERQPSDDDLCQTALALYMNRYSDTITTKIVPHLRNHIINAQNSEHHKKFVTELRSIFASRFERGGSPQLELYMHELITLSLEDAFRERDLKALFHQQELEQERWKFKVALLTNLGTAALTALIAAYLN